MIRSIMATLPVMFCIVVTFRVYAMAMPLGKNDYQSLLSAINTEEGESWISIHPKEPLVIFGRHDGNFSNHRLMITRLENGIWLEPTTVPFAQNMEARAARFSPDGKAVFFSAKTTTASGETDWNIWRANYNGDNCWSETIIPVEAINSKRPDFHPSVTAEGVVYFGSRREGGAGNSDMYRAEKQGETWLVKPVSELNSALSEPDPYVSPDENLLIFARTNAPDGYGGDDLYYSRRHQNGWSVPYNLGSAVNSAEYEYGAFVTVDGKTLFFTTFRPGHADIAFVPLSSVIGD